MHIAKVINNNIVVAHDGRDLVILTGRGIGFGMRQGGIVDAQRVSGVFRPADPGEREELTSRLIDIAPEYVSMARSLIERCRARGLGPVTAEAVVPIADHLSFAVKRLRMGLQLESSLALEIPGMFPEAHAVAAEFLKELNERLGIDLPDSESIALTLHLVNASLPAGAHTEQLVEVMDRILRIVEAQSGLSLNRTSSPVARFTTHMRLLLTRLVTATWATDGLPALGPMLPRVRRARIRPCP